jgi:16S rRNA processing protein RimM
VRSERMPDPPNDFLTIGKILKTHGRHGEVSAEVLTDFPDRFDAGAKLLLWDGTAAESQLLEVSRFHKGRMILKFAGCDSISTAELLVGRWIVVPQSARRPLPAGAVYLSDLIGCAVREGSEALGIVEAIEEAPGAPILLRVRTAEGELLIPFAEEICETVDVHQKEIRVRLPEGLRELNCKAATSAGPQQTAVSRRSRRS